MPCRLSEGLWEGEREENRGCVTQSTERHNGGMGERRGEISLERGAACLLGATPTLIHERREEKMKFSSLPFLRQIQLRQPLVQRAVASLGPKLKKGER